DQLADVKSLAWIAQPVFGFRGSVVDLHPETAGQGEDDLFQFPMRMPAAFGVYRNVVEVIDAGNLERDVIAALDKSQIAPRIVDLGKLDFPDKAIVLRHPARSSSRIARY